MMCKYPGKPNVYN